MNPRATRLRRLATALAAAGAIGAIGAAGPAGAADTLLRFESIQPGSSTGQFGVAWTQAVEKGTKYKLQVSTGKAVTKTALVGGQGKVELFFVSPGIAHAMKTGTAMYAKVKDAQETATHLRGIINFPLGVYHYVVYESSGIKTLADLKGKKVFLGPPGGQAPLISGLVIQAASGLKAGTDYQLMRFDWTSGRTAFTDRQMDMTGPPTSAPSPLIAEYAAAEKIRILGLPKAALDTPEMKRVLQIPGVTLATLDPKVYAPNIANTEPVTTVAAWIGLATHDKLPEQVVYDMLKAYWDNLSLVHATAAWMKTDLTRETALGQMNLPLHPGAYRYYKEHGFKVPDSLKPPEMK